MAHSFDDFSDVYPAMIDWEKRIAHESSFYRRLVDQFGAQSALDVACGTGHHAAMLSSWGLSVEAADISQDMLRRAALAHSHLPNLRFVHRGFEEPANQPGRFDLAICVGNSLALAPSPEIAAEAVRQMLAAVRPGGAIVVHVLNLWALPDGPCVWQKCLRTTTAEGESLIIKGVHRAGPRGFVNLIVSPLSHGKPTMRTQSAEFMGIDPDWISQTAGDAGASQITLYGGYQDQPYERQRSVDLIMVARR